MKIFKKMLALVLVLLMCASMLSVIACNSDDESSDTSTNTNTNTNTDTSTNSQGAKVDYTINVKSVGGLPLSNVTLAVYEGDNMKEFGTTDENGQLTIKLNEGGSYVAKIRTAPKGYKYSESGYTLSSAGTPILLSSSLIEGNSFPTTRLELGTVMNDFTVTDAITNKKVSLSDLFNGPDGVTGTADDKKAVLLNFFFTTCGPCANEVPYMIAAYEEYKDEIAVMAISPYPEDDKDKVALFAQQMGMPFTAAKVPTNWSLAIQSATGSTAYPTNIIIDRYGVVTLIETGGITSQTPFNLMFEFFGSDKYVQTLVTSMEQITPVETPNVDMPSSEEIGQAINKDDITIEYFGEDNEMAWPFVVKTDENGNKYIETSNSATEGSPKINSFAQINATVTLKAGQALAFDYLATTSSDDVFYIFVEGKDIFTITGISEDWETCYAYVAEEDGTYEISLLYYKDDASTEDPAKDGIKIDNMRVANATDINKETYISRYAATKPDANGKFTKYATLVVDADGFYRIGTADGPYLLAEMIYVSQFSGSQSVTSLLYSDALTMLKADELLALERYCQYASNSSFYGLTAVTEELGALLKKIAQTLGDSKHEYEWLEFCEYFSAYGTTKQIQNPIKGLADFCAFETVERTEENPDAVNYVVYDRGQIMPRGLLYKFVATKSGAYRITTNSEKEVQGWIFLDSKKTLYTDSEKGERLSYLYTNNNTNNCTMVAYFEQGKEYYIDIAFYDVTETGSFTFTVDYIAPSFNYFVEASPGPFTFEENENFNPDTLENMGATIAGGVDVVLGSDGYYHVLGTHKTEAEAIKNATSQDKVVLCTRKDCQECIKFSRRYYHTTILTTLRDMYERYNEDASVTKFNIAFRDDVALANALACIESFITSDDATMATNAKSVATTLATAISQASVVSDQIQAVVDLISVLNKDGVTKEEIADKFDNLEAVITAGDEYYHSEGSILYADFLFTTNIFTAQNLQAVVNAGALNLSRTSNDQQALAYISSFEVQYIIDTLTAELKGDLTKDQLVAIINGKAPAPNTALADAIEVQRAKYQADDNIAKSYFKELWADDYDENYAEYQLDDIFNGILHGVHEKSANDQFVLDKIAEFEQTYGEGAWIQGFVELWGDSFSTNYNDVYKVDEVIVGKYHGEPVDYTDDFNAYVEKMIKAETNEDGEVINAELNGCVAVDEELARLLQILMDKFTFEKVEHSWTKLCYYYEYIGA